MIQPETLCTQEFFRLVSDPKVVGPLFADEGAPALRIDLAADDPEVLHAAYHERAGTLNSPIMRRMGALIREELKVRYDLSEMELKRALTESYNRAHDNRSLYGEA